MQSVKIGGHSLGLGQRVGKGGEGEVFEVVGKPDQVIKLYGTSIRPQREEKVRAMVAGLLAAKTDLIAFPKEVAFDQAGRFVGFLMRFVRGYRPIHELYSPKSRKQRYPQADYRFLVRAALNVARAVGKVHETGCVIGDLNHSGVLVSANSTIALIDADSFQFSANGKHYPCVVGVPEFTPPELHGVKLSTVKRTVAHDNFGLAVLIFHLLAMGRHPYAGRYAGADIGLGEAIEQNRFAFSLLRKNETRTSPPPASVTLEDFADDIKNAFESAFGLDPAERPSAADWVGLLKQLEGSLSKCSSTPTHYFPSKAKTCVWCRLSAESGVDMFPRAFEASPYGAQNGQFEIQPILAAFLAIKLPVAEELLPKWLGSISTPSADVASAKDKRTGNKAFGILALLGAITGVITLPPLFVVWLILAGLGIAMLSGSSSVDKAPFLQKYAEVSRAVEESQRQHLKRIGALEFASLRTELDGWIGQYRGLDIELTKRLNKLQSEREQRQRDAYLDQFSIRDATISGIGVAKKAMLASYSIETAADVKAHTVRAVPGFGDALTGKMISWRKAHETNFRYNPNADALDKQAEATARAEWSLKRLDLQSKIRSGLSSLQSAPSILRDRAKNVDPALLRLLEAQAQLAYDLKALGVAIPAPTQISSWSASFNNAPRSSTSSVPHTSQSPAPSVPPCPKCGSAMRRRTARRGARSGSQFWGCSRYPSCNGTRN